MSQKRLSMRKIRELLRLKYDLGRSHREIARSLGIAASTVSDYVRRASAAGFSWPLPEGLDDAALEAVLFPAPPPSRVPRPEPNWEQVHRELRRHKGVTLQLLWLEYRAVHPNGYQYSWFCERYRAWRGRIDVVMRQVYRRARRRSWTTRARSSKSWTGRPARRGTSWSSSVSSARRTTPSWT